jgi:hypothetical protein
MAKFNAILQLRRDNDYNYKKIEDKFIPANGEICLIDTARSGLRAVCGDGITPFAQLDFIDNVLLRGYYDAGVFYKDASLTEPYDNNTNIIYIDIKTNAFYYFDGESYKTINASLPTATAEIPGIMKLYSTVGQSEDGTMTQKAITDELSEKVEVTLNINEELIIFSND